MLSLRNVYPKLVLRALAALALIVSPLVVGRAIADPLQPFETGWNSPETDDSWPTSWGDVNGDGLLDHVVGNKNQVSRVYKNNGDSTFTLVWSSAEAKKTKGIALGDFDGDNDLDMAVGNYNQPCQIYANDGQGNFSLVWTSANSDRTRAVAWGDADRDGDLDLYVGNNAQGNRVYRNDGNNTFTLLWTSTRLSRTRSLALGDVDGDGDLDYVAGNYNQANRLYKNDGHGNYWLAWSATETDPTRELALGDMDADGDLDLVVSNYLQSDRVYLNDGHGQFTLSWTGANQSPTRFVALGDLDGDGDMDFLSANFGSDTELYTNNGSASFSRTAITGGGNARSVALGDADNDGDLDFIQGNFQGQNNYFKNNSTVVNTAPTAPVLTTEPDHIGQNATRLIRLTWSAGADAETPTNLLTYNLRIGATPGGQDIMTAALPAKPGNRGQGLFYKIMLPATTSGVRYYWSVQTVDNTGFKRSPFATEQSFVVKRDTTAPAPPTNVSDVGAATNVTNALSFSWTAPTDEESGIFHYLVSLGTTPGGAQLVASQSIGVTTSHTFTGLNLSEGQTYYATVEAVNGVALTSSAVSTDGVVVDLTEPPSVTTFQQTSNPTSDSATDLSISWQPPPVTTDVDHYQATLLDSDQTVVSQSVVTTPSVTFTNLDLTVSESYTVEVVVVDTANNTSDPLVSDPILIVPPPPPADTTAPSQVANLTDEGATTTNTTHLSASWTAATDNVGVTGYEVALLNGVNVVSESTVTGAQAVFSGLSLTLSETYTIRVIAVDAAGNHSVAANTDGIMVTAPTPPPDPPPVDPPPVDEPCSAFADANNDCAFTRADVVALMQYLNGKTTIPNAVLTQMKVSQGAGALSVDDVNLLMRCALNQLTDTVTYSWCPTASAAKEAAP